MNALPIHTKQKKVSNASAYLGEKNKNHSQQKQAKQVPCVVATTKLKALPDNADNIQEKSLGGEKLVEGCVLTRPTQTIETPNKVEVDNTRTTHSPDIQLETWLKNYKEFKLKCWKQGITDKEEVVLLYDIF